MSFDFEKLVHLIEERARQNIFRSELGVCCISGETSTSQNTSPTSSAVQVVGGSSSAAQQKQLIAAAKKKTLPNQTSVAGGENSLNSTGVPNSNLMLQHEMRNRLLLYKQFASLNKNFNISTHLIHEKFLVCPVKRCRDTYS